MVFLYVLHKVNKEVYSLHFLPGIGVTKSALIHHGTGVMSFIEQKELTKDYLVFRIVDGEISHNITEVMTAYGFAPKQHTEQ